MPLNSRLTNLILRIPHPRAEEYACVMALLFTAGEHPVFHPCIRRVALEPEHIDIEFSVWSGGDLSPGALEIIAAIQAHDLLRGDRKQER